MCKSAKIAVEEASVMKDNEIELAVDATRRVG